jgi:hypothetical protein
MRIEQILHLILYIYFSIQNKEDKGKVIHVLNYQAMKMYPVLNKVLHQDVWGMEV